MRDTRKRIEALEAQSAAMNREPVRVVRQIVGCRDGVALPWNPMQAKCAEQVITRHGDESTEAFEARALASFPGNVRIIIGGCHA